MKWNVFFLLITYHIYSSCNEPAAEQINSPAIPVLHLQKSDPSDLLVRFDTISFMDHDLLAPGRGANTWYTNKQYVQVPTPGITTWSLDNDTRFLWSDIETEKEGVYNWANFDWQFNRTIDSGQRFSFGIMPVCNSCNYEGIPETEGFKLGYPQYVHDSMQHETVKDWSYAENGEKIWIPNWNSEFYLTNFKKLLKAIARHIDTSQYNHVRYKDVVYRIDVRGYGNWGEWHTFPWINCRCIPGGSSATDSTLIRIVDSFIESFPNYPLIAMVNSFVTSPRVAHHVLTARNNWGPLGWRSDHLGTTEKYFKNETVYNPYTFQGTELKTLIMDRWKTSPVVGEPLNTLGAVSANEKNCAFFDLPNQVILYHISQFSNENLVSTGEPCADNLIRDASKLAGYRLTVREALISMNKKDSIIVSINWSNTGVAPVYEKWDVILQLTERGKKPVWTGRSVFQPTMFLPGSVITHDGILLPKKMDKKNYELSLVIKDPLNYRKPLPLAIKGIRPDGSYLIASLSVNGK